MKGQKMAQEFHTCTVTAEYRCAPRSTSAYAQATSLEKVQKESTFPLPLVPEP